ncbi:hypothetical protein DSO57_1027421, partial [Entomophthora muscae]
MIASCSISLESHPYPGYMCVLLLMRPSPTFYVLAEANLFVFSFSTPVPSCLHNGYSECSQLSVKTSSNSLLLLEKDAVVIHMCAFLQARVDLASNKDNMLKNDYV